MNQLKYATLREANFLRLPQFKNKHGEPAHSMPDGSDWNLSEWLECVTGELGELCNLHKKYRRGDITKEEWEREAPKEFADIACYLDLAAFRAKIDLGQAVCDKFNEVSMRVKSNIFLLETPRGVQVIVKPEDLTLNLNTGQVTPESSGFQKKDHQDQDDNNV